jgi:fused signal recognition particle receptor
MDNQILYFTVVGVTVFVGIALTVVYYFFRYYVKTSSDDTEVAPSLKGSKDSQKKGAEVKPEASLKGALLQTKKGFWGRIESAFSSTAQFSDSEIEALEEALYTSDIGPHMASRLFDLLSKEIKNKRIQDVAALNSFLRSEMQSVFDNVRATDLWLLNEKPTVWMVVGVNGVGKTTTIGKLSAQARDKGLKVLIVSADTYRAAADLQLEEWANRAQVELYKNLSTKDPSAVAYAGLEYAKANDFDLVIVDTAGRLHTEAHLMEELKKTKKVMSKIFPHAPTETLLVVDGNSGQNALTQGRMFHDRLGLTGVVVTKLDGTSKGGVVLGLVSELKVPVRLIGIGEAIKNLKMFNAKEFVDSIL